MSKITHTKKIIEYKYAFKGYFKVWHKVNDEIRTIISYIKDDLQISPKKNIAGKQKRENHYDCMVMEWKTLLTMNNVEKHIKIEDNIRKDDISCW